MAIPIDGLFLSDDHRIRVHTGTGPGKMARWTIDRAQLDLSPPEKIIVREVRPTAAYLGHKGGLSYLPGEFAQPMRARDDQLATLGNYFAEGTVTRLGAVTPLLRTVSIAATEA